MKNIISFKSPTRISVPKISVPKIKNINIGGLKTPKVSVKRIRPPRQRNMVNRFGRLIV